MLNIYFSNIPNQPTIRKPSLVPRVFMFMLRSSFLYACETYCNLKETEVRQSERIEDTSMRKLLKTTKGCPIVQIYIELGQIPARFDIMKIRLSC